MKLIICGITTVGLTLISFVYTAIIYIIGDNILGSTPGYSSKMGGLGILFTMIAVFITSVYAHIIYGQDKQKETISTCIAFACLAPVLLLVYADSGVRGVIYGIIAVNIALILTLLQRKILGLYLDKNNK